MSEWPDPISVWRDVSAAAAGATGYRPATAAAVRRWSGLASIGVMAAALAIIVTGLALRPSTGPGGNGPVVAQTDDGMFRLQLYTPRGIYVPGDAIASVASVTYLGPDGTSSVQHMSSPVQFRIEEVDGRRVMPGFSNDICGSTNLTKDTPFDVPFAKAGAATDDAAAGFDVTWYQDRTLTLPVGTWRIVASADLGVSGCAPTHHLRVSNVIRVVAPTDDGPVVDMTQDGAFRLELTTPRRTYAPNDAIEPVATVTFLGPAADATIHGGAPSIAYEIEEVGGPRTWYPTLPAGCATSTIRRDTPLTVPFVKSGPLDGPFGRAWYDDPVLRLPAGIWRIRAYTMIATDDGAAPSDGSFACGTRPHPLDATNVITVIGDAAPSTEPSRTPSVSPTIAPSPTLSADALVAREFVRKYKDGLGTGHADVSWRVLSPWSRTTVGSFSTFSDGARRIAAASPGLPLVEDPSRSPDLLDPSFLGPRAADIAAVADPDRTFVVSVRWPEVNGAAAATENLVVAPIDGDWRIWLDATPGSFAAFPFPQGCAAYEMSDRRCEAVVAAAAAQAALDRAAATAIWLLPDPGCGGDPLTSDILLCNRTMSFVAGVRFDLADGRQVRQDIFCGVGPPSLVCSENPGIQAIDLHGAGYWDVLCAGEAPAGCPSPIPSPVGAGGAELRIAALDVPVGPVGHREVEIGTAVLLDGIVQEARFSITDQVQSGFLLANGTVRLELRSAIAGRPPFDNAYTRGSFDGPEEVRVELIFDVAETSPDAVIHVADVLIR